MRPGIRKRREGGTPQVSKGGQGGRGSSKGKEGEELGDRRKLQKIMKGKEEARHHASGIVKKKAKNRETEPNPRMLNIPFFLSPS